MRAHTPEISWHNRLPTLALDIAPQKEPGGYYRVATGGNDCRVYMWLINTKKFEINIRAGLRRHQKSVGAVRFSSDQLLASGDDDGYIYLWKQKIEDNQTFIEPSANGFLNDDGFEDIETWQHYKVLRGHIEDICDLAWSKDGKFLLSGSVDNSAILWDALKGTKMWCSDLIKGYVQGVAMDPHSQFFAVLSSDRTLRIYNFNDKRVISATQRMIIKGKYKAFFCDDTVQTFCRRLEFSPDGQFLLAPTSRMVERIEKQKPQQQEEEDNDQQEQFQPAQQQKQQPPLIQIPEKPINILLVFKRYSFNKPHVYYPVGREVALCARFSPIVYKLRSSSEENFWNIPYRIIFAVATSRSILIYDSQQTTPIAYVSQIHLARLTDIAWSHDGLMLMISSYDGYTSIIAFDKNEFGEVFTGPLMEPVQETVKETSTNKKEPAPKEIPRPEPTPPKPISIRKYLIKRS